MADDCCQQAVNSAVAECCNVLCEIFRFLLIAALVSFAVLILVICIVIAGLLKVLGLRSTLQLLLFAILGISALQLLCKRRGRAGGASGRRGPLAALVARKVGAFKCVAKWGLQQLGARLPSKSLAVSSWVAACGLALEGSPDTAYMFIVAGTVLTLAAAVSPAVGRASVQRTDGPLQQPLIRPPAIPAAQLWELFFDACRSAGAELLERDADGGRRWLTRAELSELGPQILVGLPALVLLRTVLRGAAARDVPLPDGALLLCSGQALTSASVPQSPAAQEAFVWMLEAQETLRGAGLRHSDLPVLEGLALWEGELEGVAALSQGDDVESREELTVRRGFLFSTPVPAGSQGVVQSVKSDQEVLVKWPQGSGAAQPPKLVKMSGDRPKPLEAEPPAEADERLPKLRLAAGRARAVAVTISAMPTFADKFQRTVVSPLIQGTQQPPQPPELERTDTGGVVWQNANAFDSLALGLAVEIGRARTR